MKKIYLLVLFGFLGTTIMAQQATNVVQSNKATSKVETKSPNSVEGQGKIQAGAIQNVLPGFPVYVSTGNTQLDNENYQKAKQDWISSNSVLYNNYLQQLSGSGRTMVDLPGFPVYVETGNKELDDANYRNAKEIWINQNPDMYKSLFKPSPGIREVDTENNVIK